MGYFFSNLFFGISGIFIVSGAFFGWFLMAAVVLGFIDFHDKGGDKHAR